jgi:serine/threonine protein kinase
VFICKDKTVKIGDMNVSKVAKKGLLYTQTGTPYYASPEVWKDKPYDSKSDIWSCGCVIYELATLKPPFRAQDLEGLYHKVIKGAYNKLPSHYSVDLNNIIKIMLQVNPEKRPSCDELLESTLIRNRMDTPAYIEEEIEESNKNLLNTIRCPMNIHYLTDKLPKPNYEQPNSRVSYDTGFQKPLGRSEEKHRAEAREAPGSQGGVPAAELQCTGLRRARGAAHAQEGQQTAAHGPGQPRAQRATGEEATEDRVAAQEVRQDYQHEQAAQG